MNRRKAGFTMIEAMFALAIAGMALTAIFDMQYELINAQKRHEAALQTSASRHDALAMIRDVNFDVTPEGDADLPPNLTLHWTSMATTDAKLSAGFPSGNGTYWVTLYTVSVEVDAADGTPVDNFDVDRMGWTSQAQETAGLTGVAPAPAPPTVPAAGPTG